MHNSRNTDQFTYTSNRQSYRKSYYQPRGGNSYNGTWGSKYTEGLWRPSLRRDLCMGYGGGTHSARHLSTNGEYGRIVEKCSGIRVIGDGKREETFGRPVEKNQVKERRVQIKDEEMLLHEKYVGTCFYRWFFADDGDGRKFLGTIKKVWWSTDVQKFYANVVYEDGDKEDIPVENLDTVLEEEETKPVLCVDSNNFACVMDSEEELPIKGNLKVDEPEALISGLLACI